jgi:hypothetical protein
MKMFDRDDTPLNKFIRLALSRGYSITVFDGEDYPVQRCKSDPDLILEHVWSVESGALLIYEGVRGIGVAHYLIDSPDFEIYDLTMSPEMDDLWRETHTDSD